MKKNRDPPRRLPHVSSASIPPPTTMPMDEVADMLFPALRAPPSEPKLRPPEYLGRNPFSELMRRAEHQAHLASLDQGTREKIKAARELLESQWGETQKLLHPDPIPLAPEYVAALERGDRVSQLIRTATPPPASLPPLRTNPSALRDDVAAVVTSAPLRGATPGFVTSRSTPWAVDEYIEAQPPSISVEESKASKAQTKKYKIEKHRGYFGRSLLNRRAVVIVGEDPKPVDITNFSADVDKFLALPPGTRSYVTHTNATFPLNAGLLIDSPTVDILFGKDEVVLARANGELSRNVADVPRGGAPSADPPLYLPGLAFTITGKPTTSWPGDPITLHASLSKYSYTVKYFTLKSSAKQYPNVFSRFGVDLKQLEDISPFPLRLLDTAYSGPQDVSMVSGSFFAKEQMRALCATFVLELFQGLVPCETKLTVTGFLPPPAAEAPDGTGGDSDSDQTPLLPDSNQSNNAAERESRMLLTVQLEMVIPDHVKNFAFRGASHSLAFLDTFETKGVSFTLVRCQQRRQLVGQDNTQVTKSFAEAEKPPPPLAGRMDISLNLGIRSIPLLARIFDNEPFVKMTSRVTKGTRRVVLRTATPSSRTCTFWDCIRLKQIVAFVESEEGTTRYGVECIAQVDLGGGQPALEFVGRMASECIIDKNSLATDTPICFEGTLLGPAWSNVGGAPYCHIIAPRLSFAFGSRSLLPLSMKVTGSLVLQNSGEKALASMAGFVLPCIVNFPLDALPNFLVLADITSSKQRIITLHDVVEPLSQWAFDSGDSNANEQIQRSVHAEDDHASDVNRLAKLFQIERGQISMNFSRVELRTVEGMRCEPGTFINVQSGRAVLIGGSYPIRGALKVLSVLRGDETSQGCPLRLCGSLQCLTPLHHQSKSGGSICWMSRNYAGQGPNIALDVSLFIGTEAAKCAGPVLAQCRFEDALVSLGSMGTLHTDHSLLHIAPHGDVPNGLQWCEIVADIIFTPPSVQLENEPYAIQAAASRAQKALGIASNTTSDLFFEVRIKLRTSHGASMLPMKGEGGTSRATSMEMYDNYTSVKCLGEAVVETFSSKVAELRADLMKRRIVAAESLKTASTELAAHVVACEVDRRHEEVTSNDNADQLRRITSAVTDEQSRLCKRWMVVASDQLTEIARIRRDQQRLLVDGNPPVQIRREDAFLYSRHRELELANLRGSDSSQLRLKRHCVLSNAVAHVSASCHRALNVEGGALAVLQQISRCHVERSPFLAHAAVNSIQCGTMKGKRVEVVHSLGELQEEIDAVIEQLQDDEPLFPSLFRFESCRLVGGAAAVDVPESRIASPQRPMIAFLEVRGTLRGHQFQTTTSLITMDHCGLVKAIDEVTREMLRLYLVLLK